MPKRFGILLLSALLASSLAYCGDDDDDDDVPGQDAGVQDAGDAAQPDDGGSDAGPADAGDAGVADDGGIRGDAGVADASVAEACGTPAQPAGRNLTVTCNGTAIDFSGEFGADFDDTANVSYFFLESSDGAFTMYFDIYPNSPTCPATFTLPFDPDPSVNPYDWYIVEEESSLILGDSAEETSTGRFTIEAFKNSAPQELSFSCPNCTLTGEVDDEGGQRSCTVDGTFREAVP